MFPRPLRQGFTRQLPLLVFVLFVFGCGSASPTVAGQKPVHPVRGKLYVGDKPASGAFILFVPNNESADKPDPRPRATVDENGDFQLSTYGENDGAPVGTYEVSVTWPVDGRDDEDKLMGRYRDPGQSRLKATVKDGPNELPPFKLK